MPIYEYACNRCKANFSVLKLSAREDGVKCTRCGSPDVVKKLSSFSCSFSTGFTGGGSFSPGGG